MKRALASLTSIVLALGFVLGFSAPVQAAPLPASYSGASGGSVLQVDVDVDQGVDLADIRLASAQSTVGTALDPEVTSWSRNLEASVAGLDLAVNSRQETAPPNNDAGAVESELAAVQAAGVGAGLLTTSNEAHYVDDTTCVPGDLLADSRVQTVGAVVAPTGLTAVRTGDSSTTGVTELVQTDGLNRAVRSTATGTISGVELLNETVVIGVEGTSTLTATATGQDGGAAVDYDPGTVTVTANGTTVTIEPGESETFAVVDADDVQGSVTVTANRPVITTSADGLRAEATVAVVSAAVRLGPVGEVTATADVDLLPLNASAEVPAGGIDCPPPAPVITTPADGSTTSDTTPVIVGTGTAGATITLTLDDEVIEDAAVVDEDGNFTYTPPVALAQGDHSVSATQIVAGAESAESNTNDFAVDSVAPAAPVLAQPADGSTTADLTPTFTGSTEPGARVAIFVDGTSIGSTTANGAGTFTFTPTQPLSEGVREAYAVASDAAGNDSQPSNTNSFTIDAVPAAPTLTAPADGASTNDSTPPFSGTAQPGAQVEVFVDGDSIGVGRADRRGNFVVTPTVDLDEGAHEAYVVATDAAGDSPPSATNDFTVDTVAPGTPVLDEPEDLTVTEDTTPRFSGTAEPGAVVEIFLDGDSLGTTTAREDGRFSFTPTTPLEQDVYEAYVVATDAAGNESPESNSHVFLIYDEDAELTLTTPADGSSTDDTTPDFTGTASPGATVEVFVDGDSIGTDIADEDGRFSVTPTRPLAEGPHDAYAESTGPDGTEESDTNEFTVDTAAPDAPEITSPREGDVVADGTSISGTAEPGSRVTIFVDGEPVGDVVADDDGNFRYFPPVGQLVGSHTLSATSTDDAGNVSDPSRPVRITGVAATAPVLDPPGNNGGNGPVQGPVPVGNNPGGDSLASTGGPSVLLSVLGGLLFSGGALVLSLARRRRLRLL